MFVEFFGERYGFSGGLWMLVRIMKAEWLDWPVFLRVRRDLLWLLGVTG